MDNPCRLTLERRRERTWELTLEQELGLELKLRALRELREVLGLREELREESYDPHKLPIIQGLERKSDWDIRPV
uniref:Uncharacterized protein n=1 Tax=Oryza sativa subsp. japonica TaxID=39947 RepID=Q5Z4N3_ORYSJ|nr:hypothetical protein [Oryza sativa Japonica Group]